MNKTWTLDIQTQKEYICSKHNNHFFHFMFDEGEDMIKLKQRNTKKEIFKKKDYNALSIIKSMMTHNQCTQIERGEKNEEMF